MSVAKITEISAESPQGFEAAIKEGLARASRTLEHIEGAWVKEQLVRVEANEIKAYRVHLKVTFGKQQAGFTAISEWLSIWSVAIHHIHPYCFVSTVQARCQPTTSRRGVSFATTSSQGSDVEWSTGEIESW